MRESSRRGWARLKLEALEDRSLPAPVALGSPILLDGANSTWDYSDGGEFNASPVFADVDGDGSDEALVVQGNKQLYAYKYNTANGSVFVSQVYATGQAAELHSTPVVVNLPGGIKGVFIASMNGTVFGWNALTGANLPGWPATVDLPDDYYPLASQPNKVFGALASGDLDGDGSPEIVATSFNQHVTAFRADGSVMWRYANDDSIESGVTIGDLDRDGRLEVVLGGDSSENAFYSAGGHITALSFDGRRRWTKQIPQIVQSSPVLADIDGDGNLEVFVGTGVNYPTNGQAPFPGNTIYGLDNLGNDLPGWPYSTGSSNTDFRVPASPAVGDLDGNGVLDIVVGDRSGQLHAVKANGQALWKVQAFSGLPLGASPIIADIDSDGDADVVQLAGSQLRGFAGTTGTQIWNVTDNGTLRQYISSAAVGHFKGDATWQLVAMANGPSANGQPKSPSYVRFYDLGSSTLTPPWGHLRQDAAGEPVSRPDDFTSDYITELAGILGRTGAGVTNLVTDWQPTFRHAASLYNPTLAIIGSAEARTKQIRGWYDLYLGRAAEQAGINGWIDYLSLGRSYAQAQAAIVASQEAFNRAGGTNAAWVTYLYQKVLGRNPQNGEEGNWVSALDQGRASRFDVALGFLLSQEYTEKVIRDWYQSLSLGNSTTPPADSLAAASWDLRRGVTEETVLARLLNQGLLNGSSDYVATQREGSWIRALYQDVLQRGASAADVVSWLRNIEGGMGLDTVANAIVRSPEHHDLLVKGWYRTYLHRAQDPTAAERAGWVAQLNSGVRRENVIGALLSSDEYFAQGGNDRGTFIDRVFQDVLGHGPDATQRALWLSRADYRTALPQSLLTSEEYYFNTIKFNWFLPYLRRYPHTPGNQSALFNVPPGDFYAPVRPFINHLRAGGAQADIELSILLSGEYFNIAWNKAFWGGTRWK